MAVRRRISHDDGLRAVREVLNHSDAHSDKPVPAPRQTVATAVRYLLEELAAIAPGNTVEVRVAPFGATQCIAGPKHTRGTPPNVVEMSSEVWLRIATGKSSWSEELNAGRILASGTRADLRSVLPVLNSL